MKAVVCQRPGPDERPQGIDGVAGIAAACRLVERCEEGRAVLFEMIEDGALASGELGKGRRTPQPREVIGQIQRETAVMFAERFDAGPHDLASGCQRVEVGRLVALDTRGQDLGLENRGDDRRALQAFNRVEQRVQSRAPPDDTLPLRDEPPEHPWFDRFDLMPQLGEGAAANRSAARPDRTIRAPCRRLESRLR